MIDLLSLVIEAAVTILGVLLALQKKKSYGLFIAFTFTIYVFYDSVRFLGVDVGESLLSWLFFLASLSVLIAVWQMYRPRK